MKAQVIIDRSPSGDVRDFVVDEYLESPMAIAVRHYDREGNLYVVTCVDPATLGNLPLSQRELFGETPVVLPTHRFRRWRESYIGSRKNNALRLFSVLSEVGIPFSNLKVAERLSDPKFHYRSTVAEIISRHDIENAVALLYVHRKAKRIDIEPHGGRWVTGRWFVFDTVEGAALVKLMYASKDVPVSLVDLTHAGD